MIRTLARLLFAGNNRRDRTDEVEERARKLEERVARAEAVAIARARARLRREGERG